MIPNINTLYKERKERESVKKSVFDIVLDKCIAKIKESNSVNKTFVVFEVPRMLPGIVHYNMNECILFLVEKLSANDYLVDFMEPCYIHIDWGSGTVSYKPDRDRGRDDRDRNVVPKLKSQTQKLLGRLPNVSRIQYKYI